MPEEEQWPDLMRRAQDGDQPAYRLVLRALVPVIRGQARRRIFDDTLVDDVVQDVLLTVHRLRHTYDPARPLRPWLAAITTARAIDALRRQGRTRRREVIDDIAMAAAPDATPDSRGMDRDVGRLLGLLPERQRIVVEMVKLREMTLDAAARESRLSVPAVKSLLHRAFARLRRHGSRSND